MDSHSAILQVPIYIGENLDLLWTFMLLAVRFGGLFFILPGLSGGASGQMIRMAGILSIALAATFSSPRAPLPDDWVMAMAQAVCEMILGTALAMVPVLIISGVQLAGTLSATTMGLGAGQLLDPNLGIQTTAIARLMGDLATLLFLILGGHYLLVYAAAGMGEIVPPGQFIATGISIDVLADLSAQVFLSGFMLSAPVIVALLLTQFMMGLVTKAVPQVNIFIVSFPLTIGIGLILTALSLKDVLIYLEHEFTKIEGACYHLLQLGS